MRRALAISLLAACATPEGDPPDDTEVDTDVDTEADTDVVPSVCAVGLTPQAARAPGTVCDDFAPIAVLGQLARPELTELSGLVVSRRNPGVLWGMNDSGGEAALYAFAFDGTDLGRYALVDAPSPQGACLGAAVSGEADRAVVCNLDFEDLALAPCGEVDCLYVADIGDNFSVRGVVRVYAVPEPVVSPEAPLGDVTAPELAFWDLRYPDCPGDCPDAESLAVSADGRLVIVAKREAGEAADVYALPGGTPPGCVAEPAAVAPLVRVGEVSFPGGAERATAADLHPSGTELIVRTYQRAWRWSAEGGLDAVLGATPVEVPSASEPQGEAIAWDPSDGSYLHVSERGGGGEAAVIHHAACAP